MPKNAAPAKLDTPEKPNCTVSPRQAVVYSSTAHSISKTKWLSWNSTISASVPATDHSRDSPGRRAAACSTARVTLNLPAMTVAATANASSAATATCDSACRNR
ncbi:hypothetical protein D3C86_1847560 [compost metagenome]